jgi:tetratricopeptide (TPR) repeat protein
MQASGLPAACWAASAAIRACCRQSGAGCAVDRAIADYSEAIRYDPNFAAAYVNRGNTYAAKKDRERAIADYRRALALNPRLQDAQENLAALGVRPWMD